MQVTGLVSILKAIGQLNRRVSQCPLRWLPLSHVWLGRFRRQIRSRGGPERCGIGHLCQKQCVFFLCQSGWHAT